MLEDVTGFGETVSFSTGRGIYHDFLCLLLASRIPAVSQNKIKSNGCILEISFISYPIISYSLKIHTACAAW